MNLVVDTSAILAVATNESSKPWLIEFARGYELIAPSSIHWEVGNALVAGLRRNRFSPEDLGPALDAYAKIPIRLVNVRLDEAVELARNTGLYAYDAYVLRCAQSKSCPLLTLDRKLSAAADKLGILAPEIDP